MNKVMNVSDEVLVQAYCQNNSQLAAAILHARYQPYVMGVVRKATIEYEDAKDLFQEIMERIFNRLSTHYVEKGCFHQWLKAVVVNCVRDYFRRKSYKPIKVCYDLATVPLSFTMVEDVENNTFFIDNGLTREDIYNSLFEAISQLSVESQNLLTMIYIEGKSFREIGDKLGLSKAGAYKRSLAVIQRLKYILRKKGINELPDDF